MGHTPVYHSRLVREQTSATTEPAHTSLVSSLPPELLIEIFIYCAREDDLAPAFLRNVSRWWKEVIDSSPRIWQTIFLDDHDRPIQSSRQQSELWVQRSKPLDYDVELNAENPDMILPLLSPLLPSIDRWRNFILTGRRQETVDMHSLSITSNSLKRLNILIQEADPDDMDEDDGPAKITFTPTYTGWLSSYSMNIWLSHIPLSTLITPLTFTHLNITGPYGGAQVPPIPILDLLTVCPLLESFFFSGWPHDDEPIPSPLPIVRLPRLKSLHIKGTCSARVFLSSLYIPALRSLYLTHLNVDFRLQGEYIEEGDSDDEARDFSQSPWSDHATGMGLRKLLTRCSPSLKILEMDFSDMRTKDFKFVFDRLPELQEFRIVASDMSDKVIRLLEPIRLADGDDHDPDNEMVKVRLPHLRNLELVNCNRLTGDVVIDVLSARVAYTDKAKLADTLEEVAVVGCDGFNDVHEQILFSTLGSRLRTDL